MRLFDNYEDDGQLSLFGEEELVENFAQEEADAKEPAAETSVAEERQESSGADIRIGRCSGCGKLLFVKEENDGYLSECSNCGIKYLQKK